MIFVATDPRGYRVGMTNECWHYHILIEHPEMKGLENMEKEMKFSYHPPTDELNIHFGEPRRCISREIIDEIYLRLDKETREVVGLTILNFRRRFNRAKVKPMSFDLPVRANIKLSKQKAKSLGI